MAAPCVGAILAGGSGRRLGGVAKGLLEVGGARMIDRVRAALAAAADEVVLIANHPDATLWAPGVRVVPDVRTGLGAAGGIHAALTAAHGADVLLVAWDLPFVTAPLLQAMRARAGGASDGGAPDVDAVVCEKAGSRWGVEPLCACYRATCLPALVRRLDDEDVRAGAWLADVRVATIARDALEKFGDSEVLLMDVDNERDLAAARSAAAASA